MPALTTALSVWDQAARDADVTLALPGGVPMFLRRIPAGRFRMGARGEYHVEEPVHRVLIPREFFLGTFVVTQEQYQAVATQCPGLKENPDPRELHDPPGSGGLLMAMYHYHRLLTLGQKGFEGDFAHGGNEPYYIALTDNKTPRWVGGGADAETLVTEHAAVKAKWYFFLPDNRLLGCEVSLAKGEDPCELTFGDYVTDDGRQVPHRIEVRLGDELFGIIHVNTIQTAKKQP